MFIYYICSYIFSIHFCEREIFETLLDLFNVESEKCHHKFFYSLKQAVKLINLGQNHTLMFELFTKVSAKADNGLKIYVSILFGAEGEICCSLCQISLLSLYNDTTVQCHGSCHCYWLSFKGLELTFRRLCFSEVGDLLCWCVQKRGYGCVCGFEVITSDAS